MPNTGYFDTLFCASGDKAAVPDATQPDGSVSYEQGFTVDYTLPIGNLDRKTVPRNQTNQLYYDITSALQQYQQKGVPPFITTSMNGGSPFSYSQGDRVVTGGVIYISLVNTNTTTPPGASWSTILPPVLGGTGIASYAIGDILYASASGTLAKLADVATGNVLLSGGVATAPAYGKVDLTAAVSGVLPVANGGSGGSGAALPKAWVNFDGTGTPSILGSYNVSSLTDNGTGDYTVNFTSTLSSSTYTISGIASGYPGQSGAGAVHVIGLDSTSGTITTKTTSAVRILTINNDGDTPLDTTNNSVVII